MAHLDKVIVWQRADGGISVTYIDDRDRLDQETDEQLIERIGNKHGADEALIGAVKNTVDKYKIPKSKEDREHWSFDGNVVAVDLTKVQAAADELQAKETQREAVLNKLGITKEEAAVLNADILKG